MDVERHEERPNALDSGRVDLPPNAGSQPAAGGRSHPTGALPFGDWDGHCHTGLGGHGSGEAAELFAERALRLGFGRVTFTEHPLFPVDAIPVAVYREVYLDSAGLEMYVAAVERVRHLYAHRLEVRLGFEVDYVPGRGRFPLTYLESYADHVRDSVLSLHFLPAAAGRLYALDMDPDGLGRELVAHYGSIDAVRQVYWQTLEEALDEVASWDLGIAWRVGHLDVVGKFRDAFPLADPDRDRKRALRVLDRVRDLGWALDVNAKGLDVALRREAYPARDLLRAAIERGIPLVYGSDAHAVADVGRHRRSLRNLVRALAREQDGGPTSR